LRRDENVREIIGRMSYEKLLARPHLADDGALAPVLLNLWTRNAARLEGKPLPYHMRGGDDDDDEGEEGGEKDRKKGGEDEEYGSRSQEEEKEEDVEMARRNDKNNEEDDNAPRLSLDESQIEKIQGDDDEMPPPNPLEEDEEFPIPMDDEEIGAPLFQEGEEVEGNKPQEPPIEDDEGSVFSLGAVNGNMEELHGEDQDAQEMRQEQGDELVSSNSKWHKHTVKVLKMLQRNMQSRKDDDEDDALTDNDNQDDNDDDNEEGGAEEKSKKLTQLSYDKLSFGISRRTACGVFFELLQLKTWDFIELDQDESYSDIIITPGVRFNEIPPQTAAG